MSTDALKPAETEASETSTSSGWDPFTVWRERVHQPRAKKSSLRPRANGDSPLAVLEPIKQGS